jgi:lipoprotein-releasing system permease protein
MRKNFYWYAPTGYFWSLKPCRLNVASFIARRISFNRDKSFSRFIIRLAVAATAISIAAMILTLAFTNGFQFAISQKVFSLWGNIRVQHFEGNRSIIAEETPIDRNDTVMRILHADPNIATVQEFATRNGILRGKKGIEGVLLKGVGKGYDFRRLDGFLKNGRWLHFPDSGYSNEVDISSYTAKQLVLRTGDKALIYFIQPDGATRVRPVTVAGIFKTGIEDYDKLIAFGDLKLIQRLNNWTQDQIGGYEIFIKDYRKADTVNTLVFNELPSTWSSRTIEDINPNIFDWLNLQNITIAIVLVIMVVVATLNLVTCLIILVLERTPMIGIMKAVGAPDLSIQKIFLYNGAFIAVSGMLFGNFAGLLICWLQQRYGFITLPEDAYFISKAVVKLEWWHLILVNAGTFIVCFLVLMIPTLIIRKIRPAKAITFR